MWKASIWWNNKGGKITGPTTYQFDTQQDLFVYLASQPNNIYQLTVDELEQE